MNVFYAPPDQITGSTIELLGQEAQHASRVLRYSEGDSITVVDGTGGWYEGTIRRILNDSVQADVETRIQKEMDLPERILAMGILKKRDRMEFAVEKAVELGASGIVLFRSEHTVKEKIRMDRLQAIVLSAMKQSLRAYLPKVVVSNSAEEVLDRFPGYQPFVAHERTSPDKKLPEEQGVSEEGKLLFMVGPEGGFSETEIQRLTGRGSRTISLGKYRLRTETAAIALLSRLPLRH